MTPKRLRSALPAAALALLALLSACGPIDPAPPVEPPAAPPAVVAPTEAPAALPIAGAPLPTAIVTVLPAASPTSRPSEIPDVRAVDDDPKPLPRPTMPGAANDNPGCVTAQQLQTMAPGDLAGLEEVCFQPDSGEAVQVGQAAALEIIQFTLNDPTLGLRFMGVTAMGNSPDGDLRVAQFEDRAGRLFSVLPDGSRLVEIDPGRYAPTAAGQSLSQDALRQKAEGFILRLDPGFADVRDSLTFVGGAKATLAFFRWEDASAQGWTSMPPLAQVGVTPQGEVFSYINTLFLVR